MGIVPSDFKRHWPDAVMPYEIDPTDFPTLSFKRGIIEAGIREWNNRTVVRLIPRNGQQDYVSFREAAGGCRSAIGRQGGEQSILCDIGGSNAKRIPDQKSKASPALTVFQNAMHMVHLGDSSNDIWHSWFNGVDWTENTRVPNQKSKAPPALGLYQDQLHMVHLGDKTDDIWHTWFDGSEWTENVRIGKKSEKSPALALFSNELHMVYLEEKSHDILHARWDGRRWGESVRLTEHQSQHSPALAVSNNELHMLYVDKLSNRLHHVRFADGQWANNRQIEGQSSRAAPAIADFFGTLHLLYLDMNSNKLWHSTFAGNSNRWQDPTLIPEGESKVPPALAAYSNRMHLVHLDGTRHDLLHSRLDQRSSGNFEVNAVIHEIGHAAGLFHEISREDRDRFIKIHFENIPKGTEFNYTQRNSIAEDSGLYDYDSIMHYPSLTPTTISQRPVASGFLGDFANIGQGQTLSEGDLRSIEALYPRWLPSGQVPGQASNNTPALAFFRNRLHMVQRGLRSNQLWHSWFDGVRWSEAVLIADHQSKTAPALAVFNHQLHLVYSDIRSNTFLHSRFDGMVWEKAPYPYMQRGRGSPALASLNDQLHLVYLAEDGSKRLMHSRFNGGLDGTGWSNPVPIAIQPIGIQKSDAAPALAAFNQQLHMVYPAADSSKRLIHGIHSGDRWTTFTAIKAQKSRTTPALAVYENRLHMMSLGDRSDQIHHAYYDGTWRPSALAYRQQSKMSPAIAPYQNRLHMVYVDASSNIKLMHTAHAVHIDRLGQPPGPLPPPIWLNAVLSVVL